MPSFMLMDLQGMSLVLYIYTLENDNIKVEKVCPNRETMLTIVIVSKGRVIDGVELAQILG
jgi:hypothetical protein